MPEMKWLSIGDTHLLMQSQSAGERREWHPIVQITLRQTYPEIPAMYYAWWCAGERLIAKMERLEAAQEAVEAAVARG